jgi:hypothetical protein
MKLSSFARKVLVALRSRSHYFPICSLIAASVSQSQIVENKNSKTLSRASSRASQDDRHLEPPLTLLPPSEQFVQRTHGSSDDGGSRIGFRKTCLICPAALWWDRFASETGSSSCAEEWTEGRDYKTARRSLLGRRLSIASFKLFTFCCTS